jgi:signal transduction histidine kinase/DNA-binding response OmpR family regulator
MKFAIVTTFLVFLSPLFGQIESNEEGKYPTRIFMPEEYKAGNNVLCFVQDKKGILYAGNSRGISIYNGASWKLVELPNKSEVLWLSVDNSEIIFVAGNEEFGYLENDKGIYSYQSLTTLLPDSIQGFGSIWEVESTSYGTYFRTSTYLFWYHEGVLDVLPMTDYAGGRFDVIYSVNDTLHLRKRELGLGRMVGRKFELLPGGEFFSNIKTNAILSLNDKVLVATRSDGLFLADKTGVFEFQNEIQEELKSAKIYHATTYHNSIAIATLIKGVYILNKEGKLIEHINEQKYGINETTNFVFLDTQDALWIGTLNGIMRVDFEERFRVFDSIKGSNVVILDFLKFDDIFYFATSTGVFYSKTHDFKNAKKVKGINNPSYAISVIDNLLFVDVNSGIFLINEKFEGIKQGNIPGFVAKTQVEKCYFICGQEGLTLATRNDSYFKTKKVLDVGKNIQSLFEFEPNRLWLCPKNNGITYFNLSTDSLLNFPQFGDSKIIDLEGNPIFVTSTGVFEYVDDEFVLSSLFYQYVDSTLYSITEISIDPNGNIIVLYTDESLNMHGKWLKKSSNNTYQPYQIPDINLSTSDFTSTYLEKDGILWFAGNNRILRMDIPKTVKEVGKLPILFASISAKDERLSTSDSNVEIPFSKNSMNFEYASIYYNSYGSNKYQYFLEGLDMEWSEWTEFYEKEYSYLREGEYAFKVRAKNPNEVVSDVASFHFTILPPWYRSNFAFVLYFLTTIGIIALATRARSAHLKKENRELEKMVSERTKEVASKNKKLEELNQLKSKFFANISHELRTPLTLINGQLEAIQNERKSSDIEKRVDSSRRNAAQLGNMIEDLLDLSKLELGQNMIDPKPTLINKSVNRMVNSFESLSESKNIVLSFDDGLQEEIYVNLDIRQFEKVINNLLYNAFKFTSKNGKVGVSMKAYKQFIDIEVSDTGSGIESDELPYIFDRFYQAKNQVSNEAGSGLGLAISREIVELHEGKIKVNSVLGSGTTFIVSLPRIFGDFQEEMEETEEENLSLEQFLEQHILKGNVDKPNVLMVEDNEEMRDYLEGILKVSFNISKVTNGHEALNWLKTNQADLIISDVMMPVMTGFELLEKLKKSLNYQSIPVILLTARSSQEDRLEGLRFGVDDYITKPFDRDELLIRAVNLVQNLHSRISLAKEMPEATPENELLISVEDEQMIKTAEQFIESRISDLHLSVREVATSVAMSERQFYRKIGKITGMTPSHFMMEIRLHYAHKLLISGKMIKLSQVASEIGISSAAYFSRLFYERFGKKASKYLNK